ncbi:MAG TPA: EAL domain-containing protein [Candidatus Aquilonibacter sp.]|jgi:EAL domain-containing protein (putative c-di-GMP-specific phosphodiesterase class I)|nr:EAL domain-containing protein [Candidatus Aquilonibacter sp.]
MTKSLLDAILEPGALSVRFQPIFHLQNGERRVDSVEALIRGPRGTNFARADILFDYVRRKKAEVAMDQSCLTAVCDTVLRLPADVRVNVNVHASTLGQGSTFLEFFHRCMRKRALKLDRFTIEIVEHAPSYDAVQLGKSLSQLRDWGVRLALDDVGLGQSNYRMMLDCDPEYFKLDAYFVRDITKDPKRRAVVESLVALAARLESAVVAEAVASEEDLSRVTELGVDLVQANILCPAMPLEELQRLGHVKALPVAGTQLNPASETRDDRQFEGRTMTFSMAVGQSFYT